jgi:hypothetical protein
MNKGGITRREMRWNMVLRCVLILLALSYSTSGFAQQSTNQPEGGFLIQIRESQMDLSRNGVTFHECILVLPDGRFHFERRLQQLPATTASLNILDSSLDRQQLETLQGILNDENIKTLPRYEEPKIPMAAPWTSGFVTEIPRATQIQSLGYWLWRGGTPEASPNSTAEEVKKGWRESEGALRPLVKWFHGVTSVKLEPSSAKSTFCSAGDGEPSM